MSIPHDFAHATECECFVGAKLAGAMKPSFRFDEARASTTFRVSIPHDSYTPRYVIVL